MSAISLGKNEFVGIRLHLELGFGCLVMAFPETVSVLMLDMMSVRTAPDTLECCLIYANSVEEIGFSTLTLRISCEVGLWFTFGNHGKIGYACWSCSRRDGLTTLYMNENNCRKTGNFVSSSMCRTTR